MLYSLLPPTLIVLSLIAIIVFLVKKRARVAELNLEVTDEDMMNIEEGKRGIVSKIKNMRWDDTKHFFLAVLESVTRRLRVIFLKLEAKFSGLSNSIREKRKQRLTRKDEERAAKFSAKQVVKESSAQVRMAKEENEPTDLIEKLKRYEIDRPTTNESASEETETFFRRSGFSMSKAGQNNKSASEKPEEKIVRPIIGEKGVRSRRKAEIKDRLEELLIERIAVNPRDIEAYERLGEYYLDIKSLKDAKECFKQVLKLNPGNRNAKYRMRRLETLLSKK